MSNQEAIEQTKGRSATYHVLSRCFSRPDRHLDQLTTALDQIVHVFGLSPGFEPLSVCLSDTELEYNRLFVGPGRLPCPPYESVHRKDRPEVEAGLVMGPSVHDVLKRYSEAGFSLGSGFRDLPDHIEVEMEFMHLLCEKELESQGEWSPWRRRQEEFVRLHLVPWVYHFADRVEQKSRSPFYKSAALLLREFVSTEAATQTGVDSLR